jgi:tripartite ATP-independent transporter DctP family solute receptor
MLGGFLVAEGKSIDLKMNLTASESSVWMVAAREFKRIIETETEGRYIVSIFPNEQLAAGNMGKGVEMIFNGTNDVDIHGGMVMTGFEPKLAVLSIPWLFPNGYDSVDEYLFNGKGGEMIFDMIRAKGAEPLGIGENGFRQITNNVRPIKSVADLKNLKMRIPGIAMYIDLYKLMGADPTSMSWGEVFTSLQQGVIDGQENPFDIIRSHKIYEVQKYLTIWNYSYDAIILSLSNKVWTSLSDEDKAIFKKAGKEACAAEVAKSRSIDGDALQQLYDEGMIVTKLSEEQIKEFQNVVAPIYDMYKDEITEEVFKAFGYNF